METRYFVIHGPESLLRAIEKHIATPSSNGSRPCRMELKTELFLVLSGDVSFLQPLSPQRLTVIPITGEELERLREENTRRRFQEGRFVVVKDGRYRGCIGLLRKLDGRSAYVELSLLGSMKLHQFSIEEIEPYELKEPWSE